MEPHIPGKSTISTTGAILVMWNDRKYIQILYLTAWNALRYCCHSSGHTSHHSSWWRHRMETFSALLAICTGNSPVTGEFPAQRPVTRSFDVFFDLRLNKRLRKQSRRWWFETPSRPLWRHCNDVLNFSQIIISNTSRRVIFLSQISDEFDCGGST